jgi:predicted  nucleic acid-binding Zn-ribbon protein
MADQPITLAALAKFHQEVLLPDVKRIVREEVQREVGAHRNETQTAFDAIFQRMDRLETEYHMLVAGVKRIEERLDRVEERLDRVEQKLDRAALKSEVLALKARVEALERRLSEAEG